jgi:hypothetical protein
MPKPNADIFNMTGTGSPQPYIKEETDDMSFNSRFIGHNGMDMNQQYTNAQFSGHETAGGINPSELNMGGNMMGNHFGTNSYMQGGAGIADDELAESLGTFDQQPGFNNFSQDQMGQQQDYYHNNNANVNQVYSNTPDDLPIHSPFVHPGNFDFNQYQSQSQMRSFSGSMPTGGSMRPRISMARTGSDHRTPMSPKTPAMAGLHLGTPDSGTFTTQPIMTNMHRHQKSMSGQWEGTPGSAHSWIDSPTASPPLPNHLPLHINTICLLQGCGYIL